MLVLTHNDTLNQTYREDDRLPLKGVTSKNNPNFDDARESQTSSENSLLTQQDEPTERKKPASRNENSDRTMMTSAFKETRADLVPAGTENITVTSAVSTVEGVSFKHTKRQVMMRANGCGKNPSLKQNRGKLNESSGLARGRLSEDLEEEKEENPKSASNLFTILQKDKARMSLAAPVQSPCTSTVQSPRPTITAWEAGWNVTNAIQVG